MLACHYNMDVLVQNLMYKHPIRTLTLIQYICIYTTYGPDE